MSKNLSYRASNKSGEIIRITNHIKNTNTPEIDLISRTLSITIINSNTLPRIVQKH